MLTKTLTIVVSIIVVIIIVPRFRPKAEDRVRQIQEIINLMEIFMNAGQIPLQRYQMFQKILPRLIKLSTRPHGVNLLAYKP